MKNNSSAILPPSLRRSLLQLGTDISLARRKRALAEAIMAERIGVSRGTYRRVEAGDPNVGMGTYAMALFVLGLGTPIATLADARDDEAGLLLDAERVPKRVRTPRRVRPKVDPAAS